MGFEVSAAICLQWYTMNMKVAKSSIDIVFECHSLFEISDNVYS
jgi:hypothetical protein